MYTFNTVQCCNIGAYIGMREQGVHTKFGRGSFGKNGHLEYEESGGIIILIWLLENWVLRNLIFVFPSIIILHFLLYMFRM